MGDFQYACDTHSVRISGETLRDLLNAFVGARWAAFHGFRAAAGRYLEAARENGMKVFVLDQERNLRERAWCQAARSLGMPRIGVECALMGADPVRAFRNELDVFLLDSAFNVKEFEKMGHPPKGLLAKGHVGLAGLIASVRAGAEREAARARLGLPIAGRVVFYATQDVGEVSWTRKRKKNPAVEEVKRQELRVLSELAERHGFTVALKPHRAESLEFYRETVGADPRFILFGHETSSYDLMAVSNACITRWSTAAYEAMACGIPVFFLNFYHYMPDISALHEPWAQLARTANETPAKFALFWQDVLDPEHAAKVRAWAVSQGWSADANRAVAQYLENALSSSR
jgi:hypothetical protein